MRSKTSRKWVGVVLMMTGLLLASLARAADGPTWLPAAASAVDSTGTYRTGHGWLAVPIVRKAPARVPVGPANPSGTPNGNASDLAAAPGAGSAVKQVTREIILLHLPPVEHDDVDPAPSFKSAATLTEMPLGLAAVENRVFAVFEPESLIDPADPDDLSGRQRRVLVWAAGLNPAGAWDYFPSVGSQSVASLPGQDELLGFTGGPHGPLALVRSAGTTPGVGSPLRLLGLDDAHWREIALPIDIMAAAARGEFPTSASLLTGHQRVFLIVKQTAESAPVYFDATPIEPSAERESGLEWTFRGTGAVPEPASLLWTAPDDRLTGLVRRMDPTSSRALALMVGGMSDGAATEVALPVVGEVEGSKQAISVPFAYAAVARNGLGAITLVRVSQSASTAVAKTESESSSRFHVTTFTPGGEIRYDGPPRVRGLVGGVEFRLFALAAGGLMIAVLAFVLRSEAGRQVVLPTGVALALPTTRLAATLIDSVIPVLLASTAFNIPVTELLSFAAVARIDRVWPAVLLVLVLGAVSGTIAEWMSGQTIGKRLCDCGVLGMRPVRPVGPASSPPTPTSAISNGGPTVTATGPDAAAPDSIGATPAEQIGQIEVGRPTIVQAAIRNGVKWLCPPLVLLVFLDTNWRHAGDAIARTVVVRPVREPAQADGFGEE